MFSTTKKFSTLGGYHEYIRGRGWGRDYLSTSLDFRTLGDIMIYDRGYHDEHTERCSVHQMNIMSTSGSTIIHEKYNTFEIHRLIEHLLEMWFQVIDNACYIT